MSCALWFCLHRPGALLGLLLSACLLAPRPAAAQADEPDTPTEAPFELESNDARSALPRDEAQRLLTQALPAEPAARLALLLRQESATRSLNDRAAQLDVLRQLVDASRGQPEGERWLRVLCNVEFSYGSQGRAIELMAQSLTERSLSLPTRAALANALAVAHGQIGADRYRTERAWSQAEALTREALAAPGTEREPLITSQLRARSEIERLRGDLGPAAESLREAVRVARRWLATRVPFHRPEAPDPAWQRAYSERESAMAMLTYALSRAGRYSEAALVAQEGLRTAQADQRDAGPIGRWHHRLANAQVQSRQYAAALHNAEKAEALLTQAGASAASAAAWLARRERVFALIGLKRWAEADAAYDGFLKSMPSDVLAATRAVDARMQALLAAKAGRTDAALVQIESSVRARTRVYGDQHPLTRESLGVRAVVHLVAGNPRRAASDYEDLFSVLLDNPSGWTDLNPHGFRGAYLDVALDEYLRHVAATYQQTGSVDARMAERALQVADRAHLGVTHEALVDSTARVLAASPELRQALEQEQQQRRALRERYREVAALQAQLPREKEREKDKDDDKAAEKEREAKRRAVLKQLKALRDTIEAEQTQLNAQRHQIAQRFPAYADLVTPSTPSVAVLRQLLQAGEALLMLHPGEAGTLVWVVTPDGPLHFHASSLNAAHITRLVAEARQGLDLGSQPPKARRDLPPALHTLYRELLAPAEAVLRGTQSLIVATQGPLASLPFGALLTAPVTPGTAPAWLLRRTAVSQLPTGSALQALRRGPPRPPAAQALMGFGDPLFDLSKAATAPRVRPLAVSAPGRNASTYDLEQGFRYADVPPLPETRAELVAMAAALGADPTHDLRLGAQATRRAVLDADLHDRRVVAFATHGLVPGELPGVSKPALAMAANADPTESPLLLLDDVLGLRLDAQWVVLSACNTAAGEAGGAAMSGLVRAFFFAGTRSVLATHWAVESQSAAALVSATFKAADGQRLGRAAALREAQLAMIDGRVGPAVGTWRHPFYWAPYSVFGDPSR